MCDVHFWGFVYFVALQQCVCVLLVASFPGSLPASKTGEEPGNEASFAYDDCQYYAYVVNA